MWNWELTYHLVESSMLWKNLDHFCTIAPILRSHGHKD